MKNVALRYKIFAKNLNSQNTSEEVFNYLKKLNILIKGEKTREQGFSRLKQIEKNNLSTGLEIYCHYLEGKYHSLRYREHGKLEELELANDCFDEIIFTARDNNIFIKNPKYLFVRAHCKFQLAKALSKRPSKEHFYKHSKFLTEKALQYNPNCDNFKWLINEINSTTI